MSKQPTMADILNMTPEAQEELRRKTERQIAIFIGTKIATSIALAIAVRVLVRRLDKLDQSSMFK
ncbi:hypothetical protein SEA_TRUCKEE_35 [Arthrobacter phage Truckee]|nr:hypothetical protein SEA_TRUCKEE_35 [Arthrobacter phage Truckee]